MLLSREEDALKMNESSSITLLQHVQEVAYCDGSMSQEEEDLIITVIDSHGLQKDRDALRNRLIEGYKTLSSHQSVARGSTKRTVRDELIRRLRALSSKEEQDLAINLPISRQWSQETEMKCQTSVPKNTILLNQTLWQFSAQRNAFLPFSGRQMKSSNNGPCLLGNRYY